MNTIITIIRINIIVIIVIVNVTIKMTKLILKKHDFFFSFCRSPYSKHPLERSCLQKSIEHEEVKEIRRWISERVNQYM